MIFSQDFQGKVLKYNTNKAFNCNPLLILFISLSSSLSQFQPIFVSFVAILSCLESLFQDHVACRDFTLVDSTIQPYRDWTIFFPTLYPLYFECIYKEKQIQMLRDPIGLVQYNHILEWI